MRALGEWLGDEATLKMLREARERLQKKTLKKYLKKPSIQNTHLHK
jgi:hypothetical protein